MKKKEIIYISLLSTLLFVSFANVSVAAPPSYVGVKNGDEFIWTASLNIANLNATGLAVFGVENWTIMYEHFLDYFENSTGMQFDFFAGAGMKIVMKNVSDVIPHPSFPDTFGSGLYFDYYMAYAANNWTLLTAAANMTSPMIYVIDPSPLNESTISYALSNSLPIIMPIGLNYGMLATSFQTAIDAVPRLAGNMTVQVQGNGLKFTFKPAFLEWMINTTALAFEFGPLSDAVMTCRWNSDGVFEYGSVTYGGLTIATAQLVPPDAIPGYEIVTIIGVSIVTILAVIYIKRKKNILN